MLLVRNSLQTGHWRGLNDERDSEEALNRSSDLRIRLFIAKQFIDGADAGSALHDRTQTVGTIQSLYWSGGTEDRTPLQIRTATPAQSRIRRAFEALEKDGFLEKVDIGWRLSRRVISAFTANAIESVDACLEMIDANYLTLSSLNQSNPSAGIGAA